MNDVEDIKKIVFDQYRKSCRIWWSKRSAEFPNSNGRQFVWGIFIKQFDFQWVQLHIDEILGTLDRIDAEVKAELEEARQVKA